MDRQAFLTVWRRYWPADLTLIVVLVVVVALGSYLVRRTNLADTRAEHQRRAICAILANISSTHPVPAIENARRVFAPRDRPRACFPPPSKPPTRKATPSSSPTSRPVSGPTFIVSPAPLPTASPRPTREPTHKPPPSHSPTPSPSPSPSRCELLRHPLHCLRGDP